ncbi:nitroreductase family deazaflavin-dependent oxidoreductase [Skermania piniformis]|uniref:Nitroreductase family deazaflavin-dependent oxidoreductase n=1 Tax=Skermania pinensis TaxID=39122 RepID=A0ABX8S7P9_9ACTN|nr:nitroreductase family deazaflavin-dependent oxidoreductase [Skermania piniformis]QXQ13870.1 nitroreductase family deazaflavin-dependent oxidoreductase [Skermania piniformis]
MSDFNSAIIDEFRANAGQVGGPFAGGDLLLLHTIGARSGAERINPLAYATDDGDLIIAASRAGSDQNPDWYHNLAAHPDITVEVGNDTYPVTATAITGGPERDRLYGLLVAKMPGFAEYETKTSRVIPVIRLRRTAA